MNIKLLILSLAVASNNIFAEVLEPPKPDRILNNKEFVINCAKQAGSFYKINPKIILGVYSNEGGTNSSVINNSNNTQDIGYMQLNTRYLKDLSKYGIEAKDLKKKDCYSFFLATYKIKQHLINDKGDFYTRVANYHSRTPKLNEIYKSKLIKNIKRWEVELAINSTKKPELIAKSKSSISSKKINNSNANNDAIIALLKSIR